MDATQLTYGRKRFADEVDRLCGVLDAQLAANQYVAGSHYSIADISIWPWARLVRKLIDEHADAHFPNMTRWLLEVGQGPAVQRGFSAGRELGQGPRTEAQEQGRRGLLFNQSNDKVHIARERTAHLSAAARDSEDG